MARIKRLRVHQEMEIKRYKSRIGIGIYYFIYYQYIFVKSPMLGDVVYSESVKCVKTYFTLS